MPLNEVTPEDEVLVVAGEDEYEEEEEEEEDVGVMGVIIDRTESGVEIVDGRNVVVTTAGARGGEMDEEDDDEDEDEEDEDEAKEKYGDDCIGE